MDEQTDAKEEESKPAAEDSGNGNLSATASLIEMANKAAERMEKANKEAKELLEAQTLRDARLAIGGGAYGQKAEPSPEQQKKEGAMEFFKGTGIDKAIQKHG